MNQYPIDQFPTRVAGSSLARIGASHGYRFEADTVHLNAMFTVVTPAAHDRAWALQLWACPTAPTAGTEIAGQLVAQAALPPIGEIADEVHSFETSTEAFAPAGDGEYVMVLALVAGNGREFGEVHDLCAYSQREQFLQPLLGGTASYRIDGDRVEIAADKIENRRGADNLSGTLALELWALPSRYRGGAFQGAPLAGVAFDPLPGQWEYQPRTFNLPFTPPPAGAWNLVLMLREWTTAGHVTRDFVNFDQAYIQPSPKEVAPEAKAEAPLPAKAAPAPVVKVTAAPVAKAPVVTKPASAVKASESASATSVNRASVKELSKVKGLTEKVAKAIVASRPFASLDELVNVKGMGAKLLAKLRPGLKL